MRWRAVGGATAQQCFFFFSLSLATQPSPAAPHSDAVVAVIDDASDLSSITTVTKACKPLLAFLESLLQPAFAGEVFLVRHNSLGNTSPWQGCRVVFRVGHRGAVPCEG